MTRIDTRADRAEFRRAVQGRTSHIGLVLEAIADAWDQAEATDVGEGEARRWSPVVAAAREYVAVAS